MVGSVLKSLLVGHTTNGYNPQYQVYSLVGNNVFPNVLPQNYGTPAIVYTIMDTEPYTIKDSRAWGVKLDIDIDIVAETYSDLNKISMMIISNLHRYKNIYNSNDSDGLGYGIPTDSTFGKYAPASTGETLYIGGMQILDISFENSRETFDDILELYKNTLNFSLTYIDSPSMWGSDLCINLEDLNLMSTTNVGGNPAYTQPVAINDGVNNLFSTNILPTVSGSPTTLDSNYIVFSDDSGTSNTYRPTLKNNEKNYLQFNGGKYLLANNTSDFLARTRKEVTFCCVFEMEGIDAIGSQAAIVYKRNSTTTGTGAVYLFIGAFLPGTITFNYNGRIRLAAGGEQTVTFATVIRWDAFGLNPNFTWTKKNYFAFTMSRTSGNVVGGQVRYWCSGSLKNWNPYQRSDEVYSGSATGTVYEDCFNFETIGSDVTGYTDSINIYDLIIYPEKLNMGETKYTETQKFILDKYTYFGIQW